MGIKTIFVLILWIVDVHLLRARMRRAHARFDRIEAQAWKSIEQADLAIAAAEKALGIVTA